MSVLSPDIMERYVAYKESVLAHYNLLLEKPDLKSSGILIEALRDMESRHKEDIKSSQSMACPVSVDFSTHLALTPLHELHKISELFENIISFKESAMEEHFSEIENEHINTLKGIENDIHNQMRVEKSRYHI